MEPLVINNSAKKLGYFRAHRGIILPYKYVIRIAEGETSVGASIMLSRDEAKQLRKHLKQFLEETRGY